MKVWVLGLLAAFLVAPNVSEAGFQFRIDSASPFTGDGVNPVTGTFNIVLDSVSGPATSTTSLNTISARVNYDGNLGATLTMGTATPQDVTVSAFNGTPQNAGARGGASLQNTGFTPAFNLSVGDVVAVVPFTVTAGTYGTFTFSNWGGNGAIIEGVGPDNVTFLPGSITISPVPEPSGMMLAGLAFGGVLLRRRRRR